MAHGSAAPAPGARQNGQADLDRRPSSTARRGTPAAKIAKTDTARSLMRLMPTQAKAWLLTALPPGVPKDRLKALRAAYGKAPDVQGAGR